MAGVYRRFRTAGYTLPKYLLPWQGGTILSTILRTMFVENGFTSLTLVGNQRDAAFRPQVEAILRAYQCDPAALLLIGDTAGQAETALIGVEELDRRLRPGDRRVIFHNIDTILQGRDYARIAADLETSAGFIDTFPANSPAYSYVECDEEGRVTRIAEKIVISNQATTGLYGFASMDQYREAYAQGAWSAGENYISAIYQAYLDQRLTIRAAGGGPQARTIILGTPAEYEAERSAP